MIERIARLLEGHVVGQRHRQLSVRHGDDAAALAVDDRDRAAPVALARHAPVAQAEVDAPAPGAGGFEAVGDFGEGALRRHAVEEARIDHLAVAQIDGAGLDRARASARAPGRAGRHHGQHGQAVFAREVEGRAGRGRRCRTARRCRNPSARSWRSRRHGTSPDRRGGARRRRCRSRASPRSRSPPRSCRCAGSLDEGGGRPAGPSRPAGERMVGRDRHERGAEQRVGPGRVDFERVEAGRRADERPDHRPAPRTCRSSCAASRAPSPGQRSRPSSAGQEDPRRRPV